MTQLAFDQQQSAMSALFACIAACEHCASACLREDDVAAMAECIRVDRDCADACALAARLPARASVLHARGVAGVRATLSGVCGRVRAA